MSLGATRPNVVGLVLREALIVSGMALGMMAATAVSRPVSRFWSMASTRSIR
jgi:hypothetical protein